MSDPAPPDRTYVLAERATLERMAASDPRPTYMLSGEIRAVRWVLRTIDRQAEQLRDCDRELAELRRRREWMRAKAREMLAEEPVWVGANPEVQP